MKQNAQNASLAPVPQPRPRARTPRRSSLAVAAATILAAALLPAAAQTLLFDFGAASTTTLHGTDDPVNYWNNVTPDVGGSPTGVLTNLLTSDNTPTTMGLAIISRFNGANENGATTTSLYPPDATRDSLYGNTEVWSGLSNIFPSFKLTGLDPAAVYSFTFYASRTGVSDNRETGYTITGANSGYTTLDAANNVENNSAIVEGITPDAAGEITISMAPTASNNNAYHFTYLGVMKVGIIPPQTPLAFTQEPVSQRAVELEPVTFSAAVQGSPPYFIQWLTNGVPVDGANLFTYTIPAASLAMDGLQVSVTVSNLAYSVTSSNALLRVVNDIVPPTVVSATSLNGLTIDVEFSELVEPFIAIDGVNYLINDGAGVVNSVELQPDGKTVVITLMERITGAFKVEINSVRDLSYNEIEPGTTVTGTVPDTETQRVLFDFGGTGNPTGHGPAPDDPNLYWNNVTTEVGSSATGVLPNLVTEQNNPTTISLVMVSRFNGVNENGTTSSPLYPSDATRDSLFGNTETFSGLANIFPSFKLTGLNPNLAYDFTFYASRTGVSDNRETGYTVTGANTNVAALNAANNLTNTVSVIGARPDSAGEITISMAPTANNNNGNHFTYLGVMVVQPVRQPPQIRPLVISDGKVTVDWIGGGQLEWAPAVTGPWTPITSAPAAPYTEDIAPAGMRFFRVKLNP